MIKERELWWGVRIDNKEPAIGHLLRSDDLCVIVLSFKNNDIGGVTLIEMVDVDPESLRPYAAVPDELLKQGDIGEYVAFSCPNCHNPIGTSMDNFHDSFCNMCGQCIGWEV